jgi:hypothetical protein
MRVEEEVKRLMEFDDDLSRLKLDVIRTLNMFRKTLSPSVSSIRRGGLVSTEKAASLS